MSKCNRCNIKIIDDTDRCPLCQQVLEDSKLENEDRYPDARVTTRKYRLFENIVLFISLITSVSIMILDETLTGNMDWSLIVVFILFYANVLIRLAIVGRSGYLFKTLCMVVMAVAVMYAIDFVTGYRAWSLNFVFPSGIIFVDLGVLVLMIVNHRNWQSYMILQIGMILVSAIPVILVLVDIITFPLMAIIAMALSLVIFLGTLIIGDERARTELKRRFYI